MHFSINGQGLDSVYEYGEAEKGGPIRAALFCCFKQISFLKKVYNIGKSWFTLKMF